MLSRDPVQNPIAPTPANLRQLARQLSDSLAHIGFVYMNKNGERQQVRFSDCIVDTAHNFMTALYRVGALPYGIGYYELLNDKVGAHLTYALHLPVQTVAIERWGVGISVALNGDRESFLPLKKRTPYLQEIAQQQALEEAETPLARLAALPRKWDYYDMLDYAGMPKPDRLPVYTFCLGLSPDGPLMLRMPEMVHTLIGGSTNSGKTSLINAALLQLIHNNSPRKLRLVLADLKEGAAFCNYASPQQRIPHLYDDIGQQGIIETVDELIPALDKLLAEMKRRLALIKYQARDVLHYNQRVREGLILGRELPLILFVLDEINAALLQEDIALRKAGHARGRSVILPRFEELALKARAAGIYCWFGTQNPNVDTFSSTLLRNIGTRIAINVSDWSSLSFVLGRATRDEVVVMPSGAGRCLVRSDALSGLHYVQVPYIDFDVWTALLQLSCEKYGKVERPPNLAVDETAEVPTPNVAEADRPAALSAEIKAAPSVSPKSGARTRKGQNL